MQIAPFFKTFRQHGDSLRNQRAR